MHFNQTIMPAGSRCCVNRQAGTAKSADAETALFQKQLGDVLKYADKLREVDVSHVETAAHAISDFQSFARTRRAIGSAREQALNNAPARQTAFHRHELWNDGKDLPA
jgi:aspartyl/glutamyl-tRNA(Asn/Gln) amidotransferase C subunit